MVIRRNVVILQKSWFKAEFGYKAQIGNKAAFGYKAGIGYKAKFGYKVGISYKAGFVTRRNWLQNAREARIFRKCGGRLGP